MKKEVPRRPIQAKGLIVANQGCAMKIDPLAIHFDNWCQITRDPWVLKCVHGYHLDFETAPHLVSRSTALNFTAAQALAINHEVSKMLEKGAVTQNPHSVQYFSSS